MGSMTDANIRAWQDHAGLKPATPSMREELDRLQNLALDLIKCCELEKAGIRDGDGYWHGGDPIGNIIYEMSEFNRKAHEEWMRANKSADADLPF